MRLSRTYFQSQLKITKKTYLPYNLRSQYVIGDDHEGLFAVPLLQGLHQPFRVPHEGRVRGYPQFQRVFFLLEPQEAEGAEKYYDPTYRYGLFRFVADKDTQSIKKYWPLHEILL